MIVVGSKTSSNSNHLRELAEKLGVPAYMVDVPEQLQARWFVGKKRVGLTAGVFAPESLAQVIVARIQEFGPRQVRSLAGWWRILLSRYLKILLIPIKFLITAVLSFHLVHWRSFI